MSEVYVDFMRANSNFSRAFDRLMESSKSSVEEMWQQQLRGIVRNFFAVTPPMGGKKASVKLPQPGKQSRGIVIAFGEGKAAGAASIDKDLRRAFRETAGMKSQADLLAWYLSKLNKKKHFRGSKRNASAPDIQRVRRNLLERQGLTASGWMTAVQKLGVTGVPAWIKRHAGKMPSKCSVESKKDGYYAFDATNGTRHDASDKIERELTTAIQMQTNSIERWLKADAERLLKEAIR
jgi:hypothetical protein